MKKCPYCAEYIQDEAIFCRFCNHDLKNSPLISDSKKQELTLEDLDLLLKKWGDSYGNIPSELKKKVTVFVPEISTDFLSFVTGKYLRFRIFNDNQVQEIIKRATLLLYQWSFLCIGIGVESGFNNINERVVPYYLVACSKPVNQYFISLFNPLLNQRLISENEAREIHSPFSSNLLEVALSLANQGILYHKSFKPKYPIGGYSPLSVELSKIDISSN